MEKDNVEECPGYDEIVDNLFQTAHMMLEMGEDVSPMVTCLSDKQHRLVCLLPWEKDQKSQGMLAFSQAVIIALSLGATTIYDLRDAFVLEVKGMSHEEYQASNLPPPSESPDSVDCLVVHKYDMKTMKRYSFAQTYRYNDVGKPQFEEVTPWETGEGQLLEVPVAAKRVWEAGGSPELTTKTARVALERFGLKGFVVPLAGEENA